MCGVTFRRDNPVRTRICLLTPLSGFCPDLYLGERPILGHSCPDLYPEYKRIVRGPVDVAVFQALFGSDAPGMKCILYFWNNEGLKNGSPSMTGNFREILFMLTPCT